jgi:hypothetical protein
VRFDNGIELVEGDRILFVGHESRWRRFWNWLRRRETTNGIYTVTSVSSGEPITFGYNAEEGKP